MSYFLKFKNYLTTKLDKLFIKYFTVERGRRRKYIWKTRDFREITQIYIPKFLFLNFFIYMCWKINTRLAVLNGERFSQYQSKSFREEKVEADNKVLR
jgi:hypothetical protein